MPGFVYNGIPVTIGTDETDFKFVVHLQLVTEIRFRSEEGFQVGLTGAGESGIPRRNYFWFHPSIPLQFFYDGTGQVTFDQDYYDAMLEMSRGPFGVFLGDVTDLPVAFPDELDYALDDETGPSPDSGLPSDNA